MQDWARAFGCPVHLHAADADWVMRPDPAIRHWDGETLEIAHGVTLLRLAATFPAAPCCIGLMVPTGAARS